MDRMTWLKSLTISSLLLVGCTQEPLPDRPIIYSDVQPIFNKCRSCHNDKWDYTNVRKYSAEVTYKVLITKQMPPYGLTQREYDLLKLWFDEGMKQ